jgi:hypothetical protein
MHTAVGKGGDNWSREGEFIECMRDKEEAGNEKRKTKRERGK